MSKKFFIMASFENEIKLADAVRVIEFFKYKSYLVVTLPKYNSFFKEFNNKNIINLRNFDIQKNKKSIINLILYKKIDKCYWDINNYFVGKYDKRKSYHIYKTLNKKNKYIHKKEEKKKKKINKIGFNWIVPHAWKIKEYPMKNWKSLKERIENLDSLKIKVEFQPYLKTIPYIRWIKSCDMIVSIVGFGIHIGSYFDKKIIMLSGPTDHFDYRKINKITKIYPNKRCYIHKKKLYLKNKNCCCMKNIDENVVFKKIMNCL